MKKDTGRPSKYDPKYVDMIVDLLDKGMSVAQFARHIRVARSTIYEWAKEHKAFSDALKLGQEYSESYWEGELESMMRTREANAPLVKFYMTNRFGWSDKIETNHTSSDGSMSQPTRIEIVAPKHVNAKD